eukprot:12733-Heterococcus_DN1.PRE.2
MPYLQQHHAVSGVSYVVCTPAATAHLHSALCVSCRGACTVVVARHTIAAATSYYISSTVMAHASKQAKHKRVCQQQYQILCHLSCAYSSNTTASAVCHGRTRDQYPFLRMYSNT